MLGRDFYVYISLYHLYGALATSPTTIQKLFVFVFFVFLSMTLPSHSSSRLFALGVVTIAFTCLSPLDPHLVIVLDWKLWLVSGIHMTYKSFRLGA